MHYILLKKIFGDMIVCGKVYYTLYKSSNEKLFEVAKLV